MRIIDLRGQNLSRAELLAAMPRAAMGTSEATDLVRPILDDVKERGAAALRDFEEKFDHVRPKNLRVPVEAIKDALTTLDPEVRAAIEESDDGRWQHRGLPQTADPPEFCHQRHARRGAGPEGDAH